MATISNVSRFGDSPNQGGALFDSGRQDTSTTTTQGSSSGNTSTSGSSETQRMDPQSMAALQLLIKQLLGGGTQQMAAEQAARMQETNTVQALRNQYSKGAAFADAQGAMNQQLRMAMEQSLPTLVRAAEGSGTSANSMRALLTQEALTRASEASAALGLQAATNYGTVGANYSSVLERLTQPQNAAVEALLGALNIAKGAIENTQTSGSQATSGTSSQTSTTVNNIGPSSKATGSIEQFAAPTAGGGLSGFRGTGLSELTNQQWNALARASAGGGGSAAGTDWYKSYTNI